MTEKINLPEMPSRASDAHKGDFGKILVIGGSRAMPGAAALAAWAALKSGAGLVKVAAPVSALPMVGAHSPCYTLLPCAETDSGTLSTKALSTILEEAKAADTLALGPGITTHEETAKLVFDVIAKTSHPLVIDADGLNIVAQKPEVLAKRKGYCVLTPHPGEFARLDGSKAPRDEAGRIESARRLAKKTNCTVLLKGAGTVVTDGDGVYVNKTGNPGMATAGSGDVLTGMIAVLLHAFSPGIEAAALAAHLHGLAGDLAAANVGEISLTARDILEQLSAAFQQHQKGKP
ncbi:MAG: NAD(P)H-hydrate dehydratase [Planctomycetota bacterium]|jgi:NAD(P)H-hydrate epimerase